MTNVGTLIEAAFAGVFGVFRAAGLLLVPADYRRVEPDRLHPGYVSTRMVDYSGDISSGQSARGLAARLDELTLKTTGTFWHANGQVLPW